MKTKIKGDFPYLGFQSKKSLAHALHVDLKILTQTAEQRDSYYRPFSRKKPDGSVRVIDNPTRTLKEIQSKINQLLIPMVIDSSVAFGGIPKRNHIAAAKLHCGKAAVGKVDIKKFFPSVTNHHIYDLFIAMGCSPRVSHLITPLVTYKGHLPQGSPASTTLANLLLWNIDLTLEQSAQKEKIAISRFVDDIVVSGNYRKVSLMIDLTIRELAKLNLAINRKKTNITPANARQVVTGVVVNTNLSLPKRHEDDNASLSKKYLRDAIRRYSKYGITEEELRSLQGKFAYASNLDKTFAGKFVGKIDMLKKSIKNKI